MTERTNGTENRINAAALYLSASFFVVLGAINIVHNFLPLFRGAGGSWWPVILGMVAFGVLPLGFGCWLVWSHEEPTQKSAKRGDGASGDSGKPGNA